MKKYILVNCITAISLILGSIAIYLAVHGELYHSLAFAMLASVSDSLDGYWARKLGAESHYGAIFDTACDIVVYLVYPAIILSNVFGMNSAFGITLIVLFFMAGIYRLVRFTTSGFEVDGEKKYYLGMPVFYSHFAIMILILVNMTSEGLIEFIGPILTAGLSIFMVTRWRFRKPTLILLGIYICIVAVLSIIMLSI